MSLAQISAQSTRFCWVPLTPLICRLCHRTILITMHTDLALPHFGFVLCCAGFGLPPGMTSDNWLRLLSHIDGGGPSHALAHPPYGLWSSVAGIGLSFLVDLCSRSIIDRIGFVWQSQPLSFPVMQGICFPTRFRRLCFLASYSSFLNCSFPRFFFTGNTFLVAFVPEWQFPG